MKTKSHITNRSKPGNPDITIRICNDFTSRLKGYMFERTIREHEGILLSYKKESRLDSSIHMLFMNFDLAIIWLNQEFQVVDKTLALRWRPYYAPAIPAAHVLEIHPNHLNDFSIGDQLIVDHA